VVHLGCVFAADDAAVPVLDHVQPHSTSDRAVLQRTPPTTLRVQLHKCFISTQAMLFRGTAAWRGIAPHVRARCACVCLFAVRQVSSAGVDLLLNWGPITYIPAVVPVVVYSKKHNSTRTLVVGGACLCFVAMLLRLLPVWFDLGFPAVYLVHVAQIINASVGPIGLSLPPKISATWFPDNERWVVLCVCLAWCCFFLFFGGCVWLVQHAVVAVFRVGLCSHVRSSALAGAQPNTGRAGCDGLRFFFASGDQVNTVSS